MTEPNRILIFLYILLMVKLHSQSLTEFRNGAHNLSFTENKGQVANQLFKQRKDIQFSGTDGDVAFHIRNNGISYQLQSILQHEVHKDFRQQKKATLPKWIGIDRVDVKWIGANENISFVGADELPDVENYYLPQCPSGVTSVRSFQTIKAVQVYRGIDLKYYEKEGHLKSDWLISPGADYRQIQLEIKGAQIEILKDGSLIYRTGLRVIEEGLPIAFQYGKPVEARWTVTGQIVSFVIGQYDRNAPLVIDPLLRSWSTHYSGPSGSSEVSITTDVNDNVYMAGQTVSQTASIIATTGAHQATLAGQSDAFIVKFSSNGTRLWGTYYGGQGWDFAHDCATDGSGNVYVAGAADSTNATDIATSSGHQPVNGGTTDAFLVKFNSSGVRLWATWYGGYGSEEAFSCATDPTGNVILAGSCSEMNAAIATTGAHQTVKGSSSGNYDAFLVKFNSIGVRQWGTFYGGTSSQHGFSCTADLSGNIYLTGETSSTGTAIATSNGHQPTKGFGFSDDAYLVKFNSAGVRQWGTYYGDQNVESAYDCITDAFGNVYFTGYVNGLSSGAALVTSGSHQTILSGQVDAFLAKFNTTGTRLWGTFYGGTSSEVGRACAVDAANNIYLLGSTQSTNVAAISTPGTYQNSAGNAVSTDLFITKLNSNGQRIWGTFYGGQGQDQAMAMTGNNGSGFYVAGVTTNTSGTIFATNGAFQSTVNTNSFNPFLSKFSDCYVSVAGNNTVCAGVTLSLSAMPASSTMINFAWITPASFSAASQNFTYSSVQVTQSGVYTVTSTDGAQCIGISTIAVSVIPSPVISAAGGSLCSGQIFSISPTGANTYTVQGGSYTVSPVTTSMFTVSGTGPNGCLSQNPATVMITVYPLPSLTVNNGSICLGASHTFTPTGAQVYLITGGNFNVSPPFTSTYGLYGLSAQGCTSGTVIGEVFVFAPPIVSLTAIPNPICAGGTTTLTANGAISYFWSTGSTGSGMIYTANSASVITVIGAAPNNCTASAAVSISVISAPQLSVTSTVVLLCAGETATLTAGGAQTYSWSQGAPSNTIQISPVITTNYSVTGIGANGCSTISIWTQVVESCIGIQDLSLYNLSVYPNPSKKLVFINVEDFDIVHLEVYDGTGRIVIMQDIQGGHGALDLEHVADGIYVVKIKLPGGLVYIRRIVVAKDL